MNIDAERKAFEAWYAGEYLNASSPIFRDAQFAKNGNNTYHSAEIRKSWNGWLARAQVGGLKEALNTLADGWDELSDAAYQDGELSRRDVWRSAAHRLRQALNKPTPPKEDGHG
ncbi:hypothetical protein ACQKIE_19220 [Luteibacter sp. NPDC031894]|uniref:hypothetical protein n=1 Tax=Luteibacter sp. NPDC031894 TaxID=3390572 RepID=UPI003D04974D